MALNRTVYVVDDDDAVRDSVRALLESSHHIVEDFASPLDFLGAYRAAAGGCLIVDVRMPQMDGLELKQELVRRHIGIPVIVVTGHADVPLAVRAMKAGAVDFIEKPFDEELLLRSVERALQAGTALAPMVDTQLAHDRLALLTVREREVLQHLVAGRPNKVTAHALGISPRTVEVHRAHLMEKLHARNLSDLVRMALAAEGFAKP